MAAHTSCARFEGSSQGERTMKTALQVQEREAIWMLGVIAVCMVSILALHGCSDKTNAKIAKAEAIVQTIVTDIKKVDAVAAKALPTVAAVAEVMSPGSIGATDLSKASAIVTKSNGAIQSFTLTFPQPTNATGAAAVESTVKATSNMAAQIAPQATAIVEAFAPGSTAGVDMTNATHKITTANGLIQSLSIVVQPPAPVAAPTPPTSTGN